jgi:hypothetical protein
MSEPDWVERDDGSQFPFAPELYERFPLDDLERIRSCLYYAPDRDLWIYTVEIRWFHKPSREVRVDRRICYVVTKEEARERCREYGKSIPPALEEAGPAGPVGLAEEGPAGPIWDGETLTLKVGKETIRKFRKRTGNNQAELIRALHAAGWPKTPIPNPLRGRDEDKLRFAINAFNKLLDKPHLFHLVQANKRFGWAAE